MSVFDYLKPTDKQQADMTVAREAAAAYAEVLDRCLPASADKTFTMRSLRTVAMWANVAISRNDDGSPRV